MSNEVEKDLEAGVSEEATRLVDDFANANFICGEWDTGDERPYEALHIRAAKRHQALARYIASLEADKRRLDWLDSRREDVVNTNTGDDGEPAPVLIAHAWGVYELCETVRDAIDAAITASDQENHTLRDTPQ